MRLSKILLTLFTAILLTGCATKCPTSYDAEDTEFETNAVEVERIVTDEPVIRDFIGEPHRLRYSIYPNYATDKSITVDTSYLNHVATYTVDDFNHVYIWGVNEGTGVISLITSNGKSVSYSVTIYSVEEEPVVPILHKADDIAKHFNTEAVESGLEVHYNLEEEYWHLLHSFGPTTDESPEYLCQQVYFLKQFLPNYLFRYDEKYADVKYLLVMVNPTVSTVVELWSFVENNELMVEIFIGDLW